MQTDLLSNLETMEYVKSDVSEGIDVNQTNK